MDHKIRKSVQEAVARMRARRKKQMADEKEPGEACGVCGKPAWHFGADGEWYCFMCGNIGYWEDGVFLQRRRRKD